MHLPTPTAERRLMHRRAINVQVYACADSLYEVEAELSDIKSIDVPLASGVRRAGDAIHDMLLHLVIDAQFNILAARSETRAMPYVGACDQHGNVYERLVGLNLMRGFRLGIKDRLSGTKGCTHLTEMCQVLPTAVLQAFAGDVIDTRLGNAAGDPPFQIDHCHALRLDGVTVQQYYPRWYRNGEAVDGPASVVPAPSSSF